MPMRPAASPSPTGHRAPPQLPLLLPSALVPMKKRRTPRRARPPATVPVPVPPPAAAALIPVPVPSAPYQIPAPPAAAAALDAHYLMLLAHTVVSQADAEEAAQAWSPPAASVGEKLSSSPPPLPPSAADEEKPHAPPPPLPPLAVDENLSSFSMYHHGHGHAHAATEESAEDCKETACPQPGGNAGGGSSKGDQRGGGVPSPAAGASPPRPGDEDDEELELGEIPPEKNPAADCNAGSAHESSLGLGKEDATGGSGRHAPVHAAVTEMSAAEQKRVREVFVGGISRDAGEADVRAALSAAGEITEVRMIRDRTTGKKHKGYCFVAYRDAAMASKAVAEFPSVEVVLACPNRFFSIIFPAHQLCPFYGN